MPRTFDDYAVFHYDQLAVSFFSLRGQRNQDRAPRSLHGTERGSRPFGRDNGQQAFRGGLITADVPPTFQARDQLLVNPAYDRRRKLSYLIDGFRGHVVRR